MNATETYIESRIKSEIPDEVVKALQRQNRIAKYSNIVHVFHCFNCSYIKGGGRLAKRFVGVVGDGNNGCYEYFQYDDGKWECSDEGWGSTEAALKAAVNKYID